MNAIKKLTLITIGIILIFPLINTGCKKGEDDPFLSLRSRKARVAGTWKFNQCEKFIRSDFGTGQNNITLTTTTSDTKKWNEKTSLEGIPDSIVNHNGTVDYEANFLKFDKYGNFNKIFNYTYEDEIELNEDGDVMRERHIIRQKVSGSWNFLGSVEDEYKNKERMVLNLESVEIRHRIDTLIVLSDAEAAAIPSYHTKSETVETKSYANGEINEIWHLSMLKNKEIHMERNFYNNINVIQTSTSEISQTEAGYEKMVLKQ
ncbi:MAG: hypothetical protein LBV69_02275 [Bacteroidales bacterium]|jgi:hypothetical protein|nr:hypothetical protein [Bacteroidales bacterium]